MIACHPVLLVRFGRMAPFVAAPVLDTGPWAARHRRDAQHHEWAKSQFAGPQRRAPDYPCSFVSRKRTSGWRSLVIDRLTADEAR